MHTPVSYQTLSLFTSISMGAAVIALRLRASRKPASLKKIIIPPFGMMTGFAMFAVPVTRVPLLWALAAFLVGTLFAYPLIRTSRFELIDGEIYLKRSKMFIVLLVSLLSVRLLLHDVVEHYVSIAQTGALFFLLAFGMILPWRVAMLFGFKRMQREIGETK